MTNIAKTLRTNLFGRASGGAAPTGADSSSKRSKSQKAAANKAVTRQPVDVQLLHFGPDAPPFCRPLSGPLTILATAVQNQDVPQATSAEVVAASEFFTECRRPCGLLGFALSVNTDQAKTEKFRGHVAHALALMCMSKSPASVSAPEDAAHHRFEAALLQWNQDAEEFVTNCKRIWEQYVLFMLFDLKGDKVLLAEVASTLCGLLGCSSRELMDMLAHTRQWAEEVLLIFGEKGQAPLMKRLYETALRKWFASWQSRMEKHAGGERFTDDEEQPGRKFWQDYFSTVQNVSWPDFAEAFEEFFLFGRCPGDLLTMLHGMVKVGQPCEHHVTQNVWYGIAGRWACIADLVSQLLEQVLQDSFHCIYREKPLGSIKSSVVPGASELNSAAQKPASSALSALPASSASPADSDASRPSSSGPKSSASGHGTDSTATTPQERPGLVAPGHPQYQAPDASMSWDGLNSVLAAQHRPWWLPAGEALSAEELQAEETLRTEALRQVNGRVALTNKVLLLRVVSGSLAHGRPRLSLQDEKEETAPGVPPTKAPAALPTLVVTANGTRFSQVTKFGRCTTRSQLVSDWPMAEPIASRSHFHVVYDQGYDKFKIMDTGSKWGTFTRVTTATPLSCGDWIRVGTCEFVVRYCGGSCPRRKGHTHHRLHSVRIAYSHIFNRTGSLCIPRSLSAAASAEEVEEEDDFSQLAISGNAGRKRGWATAQARLCQMRATTSDVWEHALSDKAGGDAEQSNPADAPRGFGKSAAPMAPLELDFVSGPRTGEKIVLTERVGSLGRSDANTIQVSDMGLGNVSRVHCMFEFQGDKWYLRDNKSTNGTWRRLSCILEPSKPLEINGGEGLMAGLHEFNVEEVEMNRWWTPSAASSVLQEMSRKDKPQPVKESCGKGESRESRKTCAQTSA